MREYKERLFLLLQERKRREAGRSLANWAEAYGRLETGEYVSFDDHEYLRELYTDQHPYTVVEKCTQVGISTFALLKAFWACDHHGMSVIYYFPTAGDVRNFSQTRAKPMIEASPHMLELVGDNLGNVEVRQIGRGFLHFKGMKSGVAVKATPGDFVLFDELDEADPQAKESALYRLEHSDFRWVFELSNPTIPDYGIDVEFQRSDMRYWLVRCDACNHDNCLEETFPECVMAADDTDIAAYLACEKCRGRLDVSRGRWTAKRPGVKDRRGYHMCQLISPRADLRKALRKYADPKTRGKFMQLGLGIPFVEGKQRLSIAAVMACTEPYEEAQFAGSDDGCTMGADIGSDLHFQISAKPSSGERRRVLRIGTVTSFEELDGLMRAYNIRRAVVDKMPDIHSAEAFAARWPGRVFRCQYDEKRNGEVWDDKEWIVKVNRTEWIDFTKTLFDPAAPRIELPGHSPNIEAYAKHANALVKQEDEDPETGSITWRYIRTADDHWFHACLYDHLAWSSLERLHEPIAEVDITTYEEIMSTTYGDMFESDNSWSSY